MTALAMRQQAVGVKGKLLCGSKPAEGVKVKLWDEDDGMTILHVRNANKYFFYTHYFFRP